MPVVSITLMEGYDDTVRTALAERLTDAVRATIAAPLDGITVQIHEVKPTGYMRGRASRAPGAPVPDAQSVVVQYLRAMEARDLDAARALLGEGFTMVFPGTGQMHEIEEMLEWARERYQTLTKTFERIDAVPAAEGVVVYSHGTLAGTWTDGREFSGIRFIDRMTVKDGKILDQRVWNDMAEAVLAETRGQEAAE